MGSARREDVLADWKYARGHTYAFIKSVPDRTWTFSPHPAFGPICRQLRHLADVQDCYVRGLLDGKIDFRAKRKDVRLEQSKVLLLVHLKELDKHFLAATKHWTHHDWAKQIRWNAHGCPPTLSRQQALLYMKEHEIYHQGALQLYAALAGFKTLRFF